LGKLSKYEGQECSCVVQNELGPIILIKEEEKCANALVEDAGCLPLIIRGQCRASDEEHDVFSSVGSLSERVGVGVDDGGSSCSVCTLLLLLLVEEVEEKRETSNGQQGQI
jgi:hypothetical protein